MTSTNKNQKVRLHVHWGMKIFSIFGIIFNFLYGFGSWSSGSRFMSIFLILMGVLCVWVFFLTFTKIDADSDGIQAIVPYGRYAMRWDEVKSFEKNSNNIIYFFGEGIAFRCDFSMAGKGKREFKEYVDQTIIKRQFQIGRPEGVSNSEIRKWIKNTKVGKGMLY